MIIIIIELLKGFLDLIWPFQLVRFSRLISLHIDNAIRGNWLSPNKQYLSPCIISNSHQILPYTRHDVPSHNITKDQGCMKNAYLFLSPEDRMRLNNC